MRILAIVLGILCIIAILQDGFETIVLPRRVSRKFRLARLFYLFTWPLWRAIGRKIRPGNRREYYLSYYGPLSLILLLVLWMVVLIFAFALVQWGLGSQLSTPGESPTFFTDLYMSGTTFITLGLGDVVPHPGLPRLLTVIEACIGFGLLALIIGYVPIIYQAFSRREAGISLLDARAGSPPSATELLRRHYRGKDSSELIQYLRDWERWCAELLESHLSYPVLAYYRSQHEHQSWLGAVTTILDICSLIMVGIDGVPVKPAKFIFAIARHAAVDLAQVFGVPPIPKSQWDRLSPADFTRMRETLAASGILLNDGEATEKRLAKLRGTYEPFVSALADYLLTPLPAWMATGEIVDDWQTSAWDHFLESSPRTIDRSIRPE
jgi:hypothetical protein